MNNNGRMRNSYSGRQMLSVSDIEVLRFRKNKRIGSASICVFGIGGEKMRQVIRTQHRKLSVQTT